METIEQIAKNITWYENNYRTSTIGDLLANRDKIAVLSFGLAEMCATAKKMYNGKRFIRKIEFSRQKQEFINKGSAIGKASEEATEAIEMEYREELEAEALGFRYDVLLRQVNKILEAMNQRISYVKKEEELSRHQV